MFEVRSIFGEKRSGKVQGSSRLGSRLGQHDLLSGRGGKVPLTFGIEVEFCPETKGTSCDVCGNAK